MIEKYICPECGTKQELATLSIANKEQQIKELEEQIKQRIDSNKEPLFDRYEIRDFIREYLPDEYKKIMGKFQEWLNKQALKK